MKSQCYQAVAAPRAPGIELARSPARMPSLYEIDDEKAPPVMERTDAQRREHYVIERELAARLRLANAEERRTLYGAMYDEMLRRVPHHPMLVRKDDAEATRRAVAAQLRLLGRFLSGSTTFLELGAGDCSLSIAVAARVRTVYAVEVSEEIVARQRGPGNFSLVLSDGTSIPVPEGSVDVAYSNQLMEHLHPDDAAAQLRNVHRALRRGGVYICLTPNALSGPHDISGEFDAVATGFHLKEYTYAELGRIFRAAGFGALRALVSVRGRATPVPLAVTRPWEELLRRLPAPARRALGSRLPLRLLLGIQLVGTRL